MRYDLGTNIKALKRLLNKQNPGNNPNILHGTDVKNIRQALSQFCHFNITQRIFAKVMDFQPTIVKLWEAGLAEPNHRAYNMINNVRRHPKRMLLALRGKGYLKSKNE